ncbi:MAG: hypothetical protein HS105_07045 [Chloracidobacterium sp.]|nr:hypothetical protein [Chloracidobacterium sp.]MCO5334379.1 C25 family cysteine peptidase [Pyrinomonadaceae bacterium]
MKTFIAGLVILAFLFVPASFAQQNRSRTKTISPVLRERSPIVVQAFVSDSGAWIGWETDGIGSYIGYEVYRIRAGAAKLLTHEPIVNSKAARGFFDPEGVLGDSYEVRALTRDGNFSEGARTNAAYVADLAGSVSSLGIDMTPRSDANGRLTSSQLVLPQELRDLSSTTDRTQNPRVQRLLASQAGVKIGVKKDGLYRVSAASLAAAGFDVETDPAKWQLYLRGVEQAIYVAPSGQYIEFFGRAIDTVESDISMYFLSVGAVNGKRMPTRIARPTAAPVIQQNYQQEFVFRSRKNYIYDILNGDAENYWGDIFSSAGVNINLNITGIDLTSPISTFDISFMGYTQVPHGVQITLNGHSVGTAQGFGQSAFSSSYNIPTDWMSEGANVLNVKATAGASDFTFFDTVRIGYARKQAADQNVLSFYTLGNRRAVLTGFTSPNIRLFDVTSVAETSEVTNLNIVQNGQTFDVQLPPYRGRVYYAVSEPGILTPQSVTPNYASSLTSNSNAADLVIIAYSDFMAEAESWANYRRGQGFTVKVVDVADVYDEFNYGILSSKSIKDFLSYAKDHWATAPQYVLLLGDASFDSRNYEGYGYQNLVPSRMVDTTYMETGSDDALVDFDGDGLAEMAIGRIPAKTGAIVTFLLNKTIAFETPAMQDIGRGALFVYDEPNGYDFHYMSQELRNQLPQSMPASWVDRLAPNSSTTVINEINQGHYVVNYSGHGTSGAWYNLAFFGVYNMDPNRPEPQVNNGAQQSLFVMLTCLNGYFMSPYYDSLSEKLVKHGSAGGPNSGGGPMAWASTGKTTPDKQREMGLRFYQQIGLGQISRFGDLVRDAKNAVQYGTDVRYSWVVLGDPMLKVR